MPICTNCGADIAQGAKFCASCGAAQSSNAADGPGPQAADAAPEAPQQAHQPGGAQTPPPAAHNQQPAPQQANQQPTSQAGENAVVGTLGWLGILILFAIPIVGLVLCIVWAFGGGNLNRRNFARACLILSAITIALSIVLVIVFVGPLALLAAID